MAWAIEVAHLRKTYGEVVAVDDVSLQVALGECFALLGPNGAGKTTTTEILEGYRDRDSGTASVLGVDPAKRPRAWRAQIGIVLQTCRDLGDLTVHEVVNHFAAYYPNARDPDEVIEVVGLAEKVKSRTAQLSGGQRRRLDVALGIIGRPRVLFLDEPTTGFDPEARRLFWDLIRDLQGQGTTILLTTHYLEEAEALADRVAVIASGQVIACDTPARLGGRAEGEVTVAWQQVDGSPAVRLTHRPTALVNQLSEEFAGEVPHLEVRRPSLEDIYLRMIADHDTEMAIDGGGS